MRRRGRRGVLRTRGVWLVREGRVERLFQRSVFVLFEMMVRIVWDRSTSISQRQSHPQCGAAQRTKRLSRHG